MKILLNIFIELYIYYYSLLFLSYTWKCMFH